MVSLPFSLCNHAWITCALWQNSCACSICFLTERKTLLASTETSSGCRSLLIRGCWIILLLIISFERFFFFFLCILELLLCCSNFYSLCPQVRYDLFPITFRCNAIEKALIIGDHHYKIKNKMQKWMWKSFQWFHDRTYLRYTNYHFQWWNLSKKQIKTKNTQLG